MENGDYGPNDNRNAKGSGRVKVVVRGVHECVLCGGYIDSFKVLAHTIDFYSSKSYGCNLPVVECCAKSLGPKNQWQDNMVETQR